MKPQAEIEAECLRQDQWTYQSKLADPDEPASRDALTGLSNRTHVENKIESRIGMNSPFCVALLEIDGFKRLNDRYGRVIGDELLSLFAIELRSGVRKGDSVGRWSGDKFVMILDCNQPEARVRLGRVSRRLHGAYTMLGKEGPVVLQIEASIRLAERGEGEQIKSLMERVEAATYEPESAALSAK